MWEECPPWGRTLSAPQLVHTLDTESPEPSPARPHLLTAYEVSFRFALREGCPSEAGRGQGTALKSTT